MPYLGPGYEAKVLPNLAKFHLAQLVYKLKGGGRKFLVESSAVSAGVWKGEVGQKVEMLDWFYCLELFLDAAPCFGLLPAK